MGGTGMYSCPWANVEWTGSPGGKITGPCHPRSGVWAPRAVIDLSNDVQPRRAQDRVVRVIFVTERVGRVERRHDEVLTRSHLRGHDEVELHVLRSPRLERQL